ncbi:hypothetical protein EDB85DRAFT_2279223 [Lactarius pseudohatsudake]|nr:hypothetical protein EDB85DRAFT_2279223 [Lactarius pseudohatsudake]
MALRLPFHARKPPDVVPSMRDASATLIQRPCDLRDSVRTYTLPTMHSYALAEDWGQSIFHDATGAQTPAMHADSRSDVSGQRKRLQPAQRRARVPQCNCDDRAICSRVARTLSRYRSKSLTAFISPAAPCVAAAAQEQRKRSRSGVPQAASSADTTASAPQSRGGSYVTHGRQMTARIDSSTFRFRGSVRNRTQSGSSKTDSQRSKELKCKTSVATTVAPCARGRLATTITTTVATCATPANWQQHESRSITQGFSSLTAPTAPASRGPSRLARGYKTVLGVSSSVFQSREGTRDKCDAALGEERRTRQSQAHKTYQLSHDRADSRASPRGHTQQTHEDIASHTRKIKSPLAQQPVQTAPNSATARLAPWMLKTPAIDTRTASKQLRCMRMTEDSQDLSEEEMIRLRSPCLVKLRFLHSQLHSPALYHTQLRSATLNCAQPHSTALSRRSTALSRAQLRSAALNCAQPRSTALSRAQLRSAALNCAQPRSTALSRAQLRSAALNCAQPRSTALSRAQLRSAALNCAQPRSTALSRAQLRSAALNCAQPRSTALSRAQLRSAVLARALSRACLRSTALCARSAALSARSPAHLPRSQPHFAALPERLASPSYSGLSPLCLSFPLILIVEFSPPISDFRAQCSSPLAFLSVPHSRAALATQARRVPDPSGHSYEVSRRADAISTGVYQRDQKQNALIKELSVASSPDAPPRVAPVRPLPGEQPAKGFAWEREGSCAPRWGSTAAVTVGFHEREVAQLITGLKPSSSSAASS